MDRKLKRYLLVRPKPYKLRHSLLKCLKVEMIERTAKRIQKLLNRYFINKFLPINLSFYLYLLICIKGVYALNVGNIYYPILIKLGRFFLIDLCDIKNRSPIGYLSLLAPAVIHPITLIELKTMRPYI